MRLENILALVNGELLNAPSVTAVENISIKAGRVVRGNLFIAENNSDIHEAVDNGAYAIIFEDNVPVIDNEIAWIRVVSVKEALLRLMRFHLIEKNLNAFECDRVTLKLAKQLHVEEGLYILDTDIGDSFAKLWNIKEKSTVLYDPSLTDRDLFVSSGKMPETSVNKISIVEQTLFETSFIADDIFYERQPLSPFFIPYLSRLLDFLKTEGIGYRLRPFSRIAHFIPVFTDASFNIREFGSSSRVLIFEEDLSLITSQISFLNEEAAWAKIIYIVPSPMHENTGANIYTYEIEDDIIRILKQNDFHFALIAQQNINLLENPLFKERAVQLTMDFESCKQGARNE